MLIRIIWLFAIVLIVFTPILAFICKKANHAIAKRLLWIFAVLLIVIISIPVVKLILFNYNHAWKWSAEYEEFEDDFNKVKDYIAEEFPDETDKFLRVSNKGGEEITLFDPDTKRYLTLPDDVTLSLEAIHNEAFPHKDSVLDVIRIHGERVSFCIEKGRYALVYSPNEKPTWLNSPDEQRDIKVKKIKGDWYHVVMR